MTAFRLFLIAPSLARLIRTERGGERVQEGYFADQPHRSAFVQIEEARSSLILEAGGDEASEEQTDLPLAHAQALLAVSQGQVEYLRTKLSIVAGEIHILHFFRPGPLDLVAIPIPAEDEHEFHLLPWFGPEISTQPAYRRRRLALDSAPEASEVDLTNAALNGLLDVLDTGPTTWPQPHDTQLAEAPMAAGPLSLDPFVPEADEEIEALGIDLLIRELARSLQPRQG